MFKIKCPNCKGMVEFEVRKGLEDDGMSRSLSLHMHGKEAECPSCGVIVRLRRGTKNVVFYTVTAEYAVPVYDKAGKRVAVLKPSEIKDGETRAINGR